MKANQADRVLIIGEDSHRARGSQVVLSEHGYTVCCEGDSIRVVDVIQEFKPDAMIIASATTAFISRRNSAEIVDLPRPVETCELLRLLESCPEGSFDCAMPA